MERSRTEIALFAATVAGVYMFVWGVILVNKWLAAFAVLVCLFTLGCFALRNSD
ncbi:MAG TPA: hypothetical protein VHB20_01180 [Verrucomicrobiae bacterium]|jgi:urea transporter|nr:hypothetical protein [Verrucomicrobiae bacterium]